ncbi:HAD-IIIA family hydrolase [Agrobacterium pusense]|uniref:D,D-heptose 1,7-bisphosphate phosphatase n=1 Tax=Agrobacterium pusense TaxID=648995 RepID=A0AA44IXU1_9HYPH|nr:HAD-IIIA family hydrolase [Agrobacterium pusense]MBM7322311.1 HAD-IIIA family hydrolase [Agrobacterium sp. S2]NRF10353.1 HAD-IIIA family hydrolase [Agrobacterium pusense]NRF18742.1 HAD-IIIA family hydrolase [Agrobacterium pusense]
MRQPGFESAQNEYLNLKRWLFDSAFPLWSSVGRDDVNGGFFEKISKDGLPIEEARRTRVVCRQIYSFSVAKKMGWAGDAEAVVRHGWEFLKQNCFNPDGSLVTKVDIKSGAVNASFDLYDHAFALFGLSSAATVLENSDEISTAALQCLEAMIAGWKHPEAGFQEAAPPAEPLRSNPHMHLFEAFLAWVENQVAKNNNLWFSMLNETGQLCLDKFICGANGAVCEYFDRDWSVMVDMQAAPVEPGHQFEWAWLLTKWGRMVGRKDALLAARRLIEVGEQGVSETFKLAQNGLGFELETVEDGYRLWPQTERIKAWLAMAETAVTPEQRDRAFAKVAEAARGLQSFFLANPKGSWIDRFDRYGHPIDDHAPASSLYHIVCAIEEMDRLLQPSTEQTPALFLDRDGVVIEDTGYPNKIENIRLIPGAAETIRIFREKGYKVFVVTNQSGIGRGYYDDLDYILLKEHLSKLLRKDGAIIDDERACPYHINATVEEYRADHYWRKPSPGMIDDLVRRWSVDRTRSLLIGDKDTDLQAASAAGIRGELFTGKNLLDFISGKLIEFEER